jgi:predicted Zn-dependent protease
MTDMASRVQQLRYRQVVDSLDFLWVRAKLRAKKGTPDEAVSDFKQLEQPSGQTPHWVHYGLARAYLRLGDLKAATAQLNILRTQGLNTPLLEHLAAEIRFAAQDFQGAAQVAAQARQRFPLAQPLLYLQLESLLQAKQAETVIQLTAQQLISTPNHAKLWRAQARGYAQLGNIFGQHRAQAEVYFLQGDTLAALEQLQLAQRASGGDFYQHSAADARLRQLRALQQEEMREQRGGRGG